MILNRMGNKKTISDKIIKHFPNHSIYIEPFFGAGGIFFQKEKVQYNILNDIDSDVFNLFQCVMNQKEKLEEAFYLMPIHSDLLEYWKTNEETDSIKKALRFLMLSNFTFMGAGASLVYGASSSRIKSYKNDFYQKLKNVYNLLYDAQFSNYDFRRLFKNIMLDDRSREINKTFIYVDPPYLGTGDNYSHSFTEQDSIDLFNSLELTKCKFAYSEFDNPFILEQAKQRNLNVIEIGERRNLKNHRIEILITNYEIKNDFLF